MKLVKLTTDAGRSTFGDVHWATGTTVALPEAERHKKLCEDGLLHVYVGETVEHALALGLLMDPIHAQIGTWVRAFEVAGELVARDATKAGGWCFRVAGELDVVVPTREQRVRYAIYCAQTVAPRDACLEWWAWSERWLDGSDRSVESAARAVKAAEAARAAARATWWVAAAAAWAAKEAAAWEAKAPDAAAWASAWWAARAAKAAWAAEAAVVADADIDLAELALRAIREERLTTSSARGS